jgi:integrase/recombinase XerD
MTLDKFLQEQTLQNRRPNTIKNHRLNLSDLDRYKSLDLCTADDLKSFIEQYIKTFEKKHGRKPQEGNLNFKYSAFKKYYRWAGHPEVVSWIKTKNILKKINPDKLLTSAEVHTMLKVWHKERDKALLAMAYESGMRRGELLSLRVEDVKITGNECNVRIPDNSEGDDVKAKTGTRSLVLIESIPYIQKYLNIHSGTGRLFDISETRAHEIIKGMAAKANISKNVYWHLLRHTRATELARLGMQETAMKKRFGWDESSSMIKRYTSLTDEDANNSYRDALGMGVKKRDIIINPLAKRCAKCNKLIDEGEYCTQCAEIQRLTEANTKATLNNETLRAEMETIKEQMELINLAMQAKK